MSIKLKGSSDGSVSFDAPADTSPSGSDITLTLPTSAGSADQFLKNSGIAGTLEYSSMVETSTGVGIGESSPNTKLVVKDASNATNDSVGNINVISSDNAAINKGGSIGLGGFYNGTSNSIPFANIHGKKENSTGNNAEGYFAVSTRSSSGTGERLRVNSTGDLSAGTTAPFGGTVANRQHLTLNGTDSVKFQWGTAGTERGYLYTGGNNLSLINTQNGYIRFNTNDTERIRLLAHGSLRVSTARTDSDYAQNNTDYWHVFHHHVNNQAAAIIEHSGDSTPYGLIIDFSDASPDDNTRYFMSCIDSSAIRLQIKSDGDIDNHDNSYSGFSDVKLKQDIVDAGSQWDDIKNLRVRKFKFKSDVAAYGDEAKTLIGVVAQETESVSPGLVKESPDVDENNNDLGTTTKSVRYSVLYMKAVKALQEAQTRIETLETQNTAQQAQIDDLLARVTALEAA